MGRALLLVALLAPLPACTLTLGKIERTVTPAAAEPPTVTTHCQATGLILSLGAQDLGGDCIRGGPISIPGAELLTGLAAVVAALLPPFLVP